jgi:hypothetical protein
MRKICGTKGWLFEKINKMDKTVDNLIKISDRERTS